MLAGLAHLATAAHGRFITASSSHKQAKDSGRASLLSGLWLRSPQFFPPPMLFFIAVASKCFGLISFKNRRKKKEGAAVMKRCVCEAPLLSSTLKFGTGVEGSLSPSTSSSRSESISKVTFCFEGRLLASSLADEAHLRFTDFE